MIGFRTKRERRKLLLSELTAEEWRAKRKEIFSHDHVHFLSNRAGYSGQHHHLDDDELKSKTGDEEWRRKAIDILLSQAEEHEAYAKRLDRAIGLPTDAEEREYQAWWTVGRNKAYILFACLSLIISIIALLVALAK